MQALTLLAGQPGSLRLEELADPPLGGDPPGGSSRGGVPFGCFREAYARREGDGKTVLIFED
jgi:hypothetical protein